jgi:hypothetical protein
MMIARSCTKLSAISLMSVTCPLEFFRFRPRVDLATGMPMKTVGDDFYLSRPALTT